MTYDEWEADVPDYLKNDPLWSVAAYRKGLFAGDLSWPDATKAVADRRTISLSDQLYRAVGSISANIAEGYSRGSGKDRCRFYEYALGSSRESRGKAATGITRPGTSSANRSSTTVVNCSPRSIGSCSQ